MAYGDLAKDLALHYQQSEQTPTMFVLSLHFDKQGRVTGSGALFFAGNAWMQRRRIG